MRAEDSAKDDERESATDLIPKDTANADKGVKTGGGVQALYIFIPGALGINFAIINCGDIINSALDRLS